MAEFASDDLDDEIIAKAWIAAEERPNFERAYGKFMLAWAEAETTLYRVLVAYSKVSDPIARAIFSGARAKTMIEFVRGIAHNTGLRGARLKDLDRVFPQLSAIGTMRDHLAHNATDIIAFQHSDPRMRLVTNGARVSRYGRERALPIGSKTLSAMRADLEAIIYHLKAHLVPRRQRFQPYRASRAGQPIAWLYTPPQPASSRGKSPSIGRKPAGRRKPSRTKR